MRTILTLFLFVITSSFLFSDNLQEMNEIAESMNDVTNLYQEMIDNTYWTSDGFSGTYTLNYTLIPKFKISKSEIPDAYLEFLDENQNYSVNLSMFKINANGRILSKDQFNLYLFGVYYGHQKEIRYKDSETDSTNYAAVDNFYHDIMPGIIFDLKKLPIRLSLAPLINATHNYYTDETKVRFNKICYDASMNMFRNKNYLVNLFVKAILDNDKMSNLTEKDKINGSEFNIGFDFLLKDKWGGEFKVYKNYLNQKFYSSEISYISEYNGSFTLTESLKLNEIKINLPFPYKIDEDNFLAYFSLQGSYLNDSNFDDPIIGIGAKVNFTWTDHSRADRYDLKAWTNARYNFSDDVSNITLLKDRGILDAGFGEVVKRASYFDYLKDDEESE